MKTTARVFSALALTATVMLSACTSEPGNKPGGGDVTPGETGYLALGMTTDPGSNPGGTRAYINVAEGTTQERFVDKLYILLYKASDGTLEERIEVIASNRDAGDNLVNFNGSGVSALSPASTKQVITIGYPVTAQAYNMIVMANPTPAMLTATDKSGTPMTLPEFKAEVNDVATSISVNETSIPTTVRFPMTNNRGEIAVGVNDLKATKSAAESAPVRSVGLDRMVAKVQVMKSSAFDTNMAQLITDGKIKAFQNVTWDLDILNKLSYWMRVKTNNKGGSAETGLENREDLYAQDPNMDAVASGGATYGNNFSAVTVNTAYVTSNTNAKALNAEASSNMVYALENTFNTAVQATGTWETQATSVLVKVQLIPNNHNLGAGDWNTGYYSVDGFVFTHAEAVEWVNGTAIPAGVPASLTLSNLKANPLFWDPAAGGGSGAAVATAPADYTVSSLGSDTLVFHYQSWNVYRIPIKHFDFDNNGQNTFGHYGVVRNNWYRVSINRISGPGDGSSEKYISAEIDILDWLQREQEEDL